MAVLVASWLCLTLYGYAALSALFEVSAALAAARLTGGITGAELPTPLKLVLSFDMLFGKVEIVVLLLVLLPRTWFVPDQRVARELMAFAEGATDALSTEKSGSKD